MDSFGYKNMKAEKAKALLRYKRLQRLTSMFRLLELCVFLIILSRFTTHLPNLLKLSGDFLRGVSITAFSPLFVFFLGNAIVVVLFMKSKPSHDPNSKENNPINELYDEYAKNCVVQEIKKEKKQRNGEINFVVQEIKKEKKQRNCIGGEIVVCSNAPLSVKEKKLSRSRSEKRLHHHKDSGGREFRRSMTMTMTERLPERSVEGGDEEVKVSNCPEEEMSNDEFRRTIEAFIARQQRALREEEFSSDLSLKYI